MTSRTEPIWPSHPVAARVAAGFCVLLLVFTAATAAQESQFDAVPQIRAASDLLPADLLRGEGFDVVADGTMQHYVLKTEFGDLEVEGDALLRQRMSEVGAMQRLRELSQTEAFAKAIAGSVKGTAKMVTTLVEDPEGTLRRVPEGVARKAKGLWYRTKKSARRAGNWVQEQVGDEDESSEDGAEESEGDKAKEIASRVGDAALDYVGLNRARREIARQLQVDPYTTNPILRDELDRVSRGALVANLSLAQLLPTSQVLSTANDVYALAWQLPRSELDRRTDRTLDSMGVPAAARFAFLQNKSFLPTEKMALAQTLAQMDGVGGRAGLVEAAAEVADRFGAHYFLGVAKLLARVHDEDALGEIRRVSRDEAVVLVGMRDAGGSVVAVPFDYLLWQESLGDGAQFEALGVRALWLTGEASPRAREELARRGWQLRERVEIP